MVLIVTFGIVGALCKIIEFDWAFGMRTSNFMSDFV